MNAYRILTVLLLVTAAFGQVRFEAATITVVASPIGRPDAQGPNDGALFSIAGSPLSQLIRASYGLDHVIDAKGFPWIRDTFYRISAKIPQGVGTDKLPEMVRNLLIDRLGLVVHETTHVEKGYHLILVNEKTLREKAGGDKMAGTMANIPADVREKFYNRASATSLDNICTEMLRPITGKTVENHTGVAGTFSMWIATGTAYTGGEAGGINDTQASLEGYGLKLQPGEVTVRYIVVDKLNKVPKEN